MNKQNEIEAFWQTYLASLPEGVGPPPSSYETWSFCDNEEAANELGDLVKTGVKTATCSLVWEYEAENEDMLPNSLLVPAMPLSGAPGTCALCFTSNNLSSPGVLRCYATESETGIHQGGSRWR